MPKSLFPILILVSFHLFVLRPEACDPILLSLISSRDLKEERDQKMQLFSANLNKLGAVWRSGEVMSSRNLAEVKSLWLQIFEQSYRKPLNGHEVGVWQSKLADISRTLGALSRAMKEKQSEEIHRAILHIQNQLISLYENPSNLPFFESIRLIKELIILARKSQLLGLKMDQQRISTRLSKMWNEAYDSLPKRVLQSTSLERWGRSLDDMLKLSASEFESHGFDLIQRVSEEKWKEMELSKIR